jgi:transcriptional regulator with XRE-family HTH domain
MFARIPTNKLVDKGGKILCMDSLGHLVHEWRTLSGLSQAELAQRVGGKVKAAHIGQLESVGNRMPRYLPDLARAMGCTVDDLIALKMPRPLQKDAAAAPANAEPAEEQGPRYEVDEADAELLEAVKFMKTGEEQAEIVLRYRALLAKALEAQRKPRREHGVAWTDQGTKPVPARKVAR